MPKSFGFVLALLLFVKNAQSASEALDDRLGWQANSTQRGTWTVVSDCLATIFACTWSVQHLNVPAPKDGLGLRVFRASKWMMLTILFPELIVVLALLELSKASRDLLAMQQAGKVVDRPWWLSGPPGKILHWLSVAPRALATNVKLRVKRLRPEPPATRGPRSHRPSELRWWPSGLSEKIVAARIRLNATDAASEPSESEPPSHALIQNDIESQKHLGEDMTGTWLHDIHLDHSIQHQHQTQGSEVTKNAHRPGSRVPDDSESRPKDLEAKSDTQPSTREQPAIRRSADIDSDRKHNWTITHCFFANMGGFYRTVTDRKDERYIVTGYQIAASTEFRHSPISAEEIKDKAKQDFFGKIVAAVQILQLLFSLAVRKIHGLPSSQLEIVTAAFAACGFVAYIVYFYKPQSAGVAICLGSDLDMRNEKKHEGILEILTSISASAPETPLSTQKLARVKASGVWDQYVAWRVRKTAASMAHRVPNDHTAVSRDPAIHPVITLMSVSCALFGTIHAVAWDFEFPSPEEKMIWRVATMVSLGAPLVALVALLPAGVIVSEGNGAEFMNSCLRWMRSYVMTYPEDADMENAYRSLELAVVSGEEVPYAKIFATNSTNDSQATGAQNIDLASTLFYYILKMTNDTSLPQIHTQVHCLIGREQASLIDAVSSKAPSKEDLDYLDELYLGVFGSSYRETVFHYFAAKMDGEFVNEFARLVWLLKGGGRSKKLKNSTKTGVFPQKHWLSNSWVKLNIYTAIVLYTLARLLLIAVSLSSLRSMSAGVYRATPWASYIPVWGA